MTLTIPNGGIEVPDSVLQILSDKKELIDNRSSIV